jgi:PfaD family protein
MNTSPYGSGAADRWLGDAASLEEGRKAVIAAVQRTLLPVWFVRRGDRLWVTHRGRIASGGGAPEEDSLPLAAYLPPLPPERLGDDRFRRRYGLRFAYVAGAMANGITSVEMVEAAGKNGMIGFFGAAGLSPRRIEDAIDRIRSALADRPYGFNLIHSPYEPDLEAATVDLYLRREIRCISASAYLRLTPPLVHYRVKGIHRRPDGSIACPNRIVAKVSREEVARRFFEPPPAPILAELLREGRISPQEAELAAEIPVATDLTAEADSGGHTDNRPALTLLPTMLALRDRICAERGYAEPVCVGLGGGVGTPQAAAAAFAMGAAYVLTGTVNQACLEAGTSDTVRALLAEAGQADVAMAPAADMFEMGVKVQVLKRGTMFALRAQKLYDLYRQYPDWDHVPSEEKRVLETQYFKCSFMEEWEQTRRFFEVRDPGQIEKAEKDPRHRMALVFRAYLGKSSGWANAGEPGRQMDYQIWCGPAIGSFNEWTRGTELEKPENRRVVTVGLNLLAGAAVLTRLNWLRCQGIDPGIHGEATRPVPLEMLRERLDAPPPAAG